MDGRPLAELLGGCVQGTTTMADMVGGRVNYFRGNGQTNSGELKTSGIDLSMRYRFDNVFGGTLTPSVDVSRVLKWELGDFVLGGVKVADGYDGLGYLNLGTGRTLQSVAKYPRQCGSAVQHRSAHVQHPEPVCAGHHQRRSDVVLGCQQQERQHRRRGWGHDCGRCVHSAGAGSQRSGQRPEGAGTGQYGTGIVPAGVAGAGTRGFCCVAEHATLAGQEVEDWLNVDLIYRVELPWEMVATAVVGNVFDTDPSFYRGTVPYNTAYGSPLGRTFKLGFTKRF